MGNRLVWILSWILVQAVALGADYRSETGIVYARVEGKELTLNAFLPEGAEKPVPAVVEIHGGWWHGGEPAKQVDGVGGAGFFKREGLAVFSIAYRLGAEGGFPENIRDCRNAVRFIRKNAARFHIDPERILVTGGSAGGYLSLMVAMVRDDFDDGGAVPELEGTSAAVSGCFSYIAPTDFVRFWREGPDDVVTRDGKITFRRPDEKIPHDSRPRLRVLFHGVTPDTPEHEALYQNLSPVGQVRADVPPLLVCDGEKDPIVPGVPGKALVEKLKAAGAKDVVYWMTPQGGHAFPGGDGFGKVLEDFLKRTVIR
jgi:acetyl esterase/lipase